MIEHELLLFAAFWFIVSAIDETCVDLAWLWLRLTGRASAASLPPGEADSPLAGRTAILVPAWREADVVGAMIAHALRAWRQRDFVIYAGCYVNDPLTIEAALAGAGADPRVRVVVNPRPGPTTKADCLNRLYAALEADERRGGFVFRGVVLHDAEDMVHPAALAVIDRALDDADFVQLPVRPEPQAASPWIAGHYSDEFAEAHGKALLVRNALGAAIPAAGVGCGFSRMAMTQLVQMRKTGGGEGPFEPDCLTEDYEFGLLVSRLGRRSRFLRVRDELGDLVATRSYFPGTLEAAVRQKSRWIHGIAFQGWERLGWTWRPLELWMALRDRRGPLTALVLAAAYGLIVIEGVLAAASLAGWRETLLYSPGLRAMIAATLASFVWRAVFRFGFTSREYGWAEGLLALLRIPVANFVAILAGRRALGAYLRTLGGGAVRWDKTVHAALPPAPEARTALA